MACALLALLCSGCFDVVQHGTPWAVELTPSCRAADTVSATSWTFHLHARDAGVVERTFDTFPTTLALEPSDDLVVRVEARQGDTLVGRGTSAHVATGDGGVLALTVYPVGRFVQDCASLTTPRSAHTATQLLDGTVLIAGGVRQGRTLSSLERLHVERIEGGRDLGLVAGGNRILLPRAFHSAVRTPIGQIVFTGGEVAPDGMASSAIVFLDPSVDFATGVLANARWTGRSRHLSALSPDGTELLIAGGLGFTTLANEPTPAIDRLDLTTNTFKAPTQLPEAHAEAAMVLGPDAVFIAGGTDGGTAQSTLQLVFFNGGSGSSSLLEARRDATAVRRGNDVLVAGGLDATNAVSGTSEWVRFSGTRERGPTVFPRRHACGVTLPSGAAVLLGGLDATNTPSRVVEWFHPDGSMTVETFPGEGRVDATCTALEDGSVLIVGGRSASGELGDVWHYFPR